MEPEIAYHLLRATFTGAERDFLLEHAEFKKALVGGANDLATLKKLNVLGVKLCCATTVCRHQARPS